MESRVEAGFRIDGVVLPLTITESWNDVAAKDVIDPPENIEAFGGKAAIGVLALGAMIWSLVSHHSRWPLTEPVRCTS